MRLAIIESNHWHVPLYLDAIERSGCEVVGVSDSTGRTDEAIARRFGSHRYSSHHELLAAERIDFAFVFGRHVEMPTLADALIERNIPFMIEKPCGVAAADVTRLAAAAETKGLYVTVPFIFRLSDLGRILINGEEGAARGVDHASFRFLGGPPDRYEKAGAPWMLDSAISGGGPLINVGVHFVDLFRLLARQDIVSVSADFTKSVNNLSIEDFISVRMRTATGQIGTLECGYTFPSDSQKQRELTISVRSDRATYLTDGEGVLVRSARDGVVSAALEPARLEADIYYADVVAQTLAGARDARAPFAGLHDAARALRVVESAYASARQGGTPVAVSPSSF